MRCYLVRHAQACGADAPRFQGRTDTLLSPMGLRQAQCLGASFVGQGLGAIYSSDLRRSVQTAEAIASATQEMVRIEPGLAEMHFGAWEGLSTQEVEHRFPREYHHWLLAPSQVSVPGGEPCDAFRVRARDTFAKLAARHQGDGGQALVVVSHGGVIASLLADWLDASYDRFLRRCAINHGGVSAIEWDAGASSVLWINSTAHLNPAAHVQPMVLNAAPTAVEQLRTGK